MNTVDIRAQFETDFAWREQELRFLRNLWFAREREEERQKLRRIQVVMLYAHFEGFCKMLFGMYLQAVNDERLLRADATDVLVAASLTDVFDLYENRDKKNTFFRTLLPGDEKLHRFSRQVDFVRAVDGLWGAILHVPVDKVAHTDANLEPAVLRKMLFRLGFEPDMFASREGILFRMVYTRHHIAHGQDDSVSDNDYNDMEAAAISVMKDLMVFLTDALRQKKYLRTR